MSDDLLKKCLKNQEILSQYNLLVEENKERILTEIDKLQEEHKEADETIQTLNTLFEHARIQSYVKLSANCYVPAIIKHTGEYNVFFNPGYQCTLTHKQTVDYVNRKKGDLDSSTELYKTQLQQLDERMNFDQSLVTCDTEDMPTIIKSDQGVAIKNGMLYEIIEEEKDVPCPVKGKRISRVRK